MYKAAIQLLATIGEGKETIHSLVSIYKRLNAVLHALAYRDKRFITGSKYATDVFGKKRSKKQVAQDYWMEYRYAVRPFIYELEQAANAWRAELEAKYRLTARGVQNVKNSRSYDMTHYYDIYTGVNYKVQETISYRCRAGVLFGLVDNSISILTLLGLDRPAAAVWELTKLSFAIDWFLNIGKLIESWEGNTSFVTHGTWFTENLVISETYTPLTAYCTWGNLGYTNLQVGVTQDTWTVEREIKFRAVNVSRPITPAYQFKLNATKTLDLAIISRQLFQKLTRL